MDTTVDIGVHASIIVLLSKVSSPSELSSGGTLKDLSEGYLELPSGIEFGISVSIKRSIINPTSNSQIEEVQDCSLNNKESLEDP